MCRASGRSTRSAGSASAVRCQSNNPARTSCGRSRAQNGRAPRPNPPQPGIGQRRSLPVDQPGPDVLRQIEGDEQAGPGALEPLLGHAENLNGASAALATGSPLAAGTRHSGPNRVFSPLGFAAQAAPAASRASARVAYSRPLTILPSRTSKTIARVILTSA